MELFVGRVSWRMRREDRRKEDRRREDEKGRWNLAGGWIQIEKLEAVRREEELSAERQKQRVSKKRVFG